MVYSHESLELEYYIKEGISPVHYNLSDLNKHFEIRKSLYRLLGLIPNFFMGKDILEVAPGSGHNSIYTASLLPKSYDLVEPNPNGCKDIISAFKNLNYKHTMPKLYKKIERLGSDEIYGSDLKIKLNAMGAYFGYLPDPAAVKKEPVNPKVNQINDSTIQIP